MLPLNVPLLSENNIYGFDPEISSSGMFLCVVEASEMISPEILISPERRPHKIHTNDNYRSVHEFALYTEYDRTLMLALYCGAETQKVG